MISGDDLLPGVLHLVGMGVVGDGKSKESLKVNLVGLDGGLKAEATLNLVGVLDGKELTVHVGVEEVTEVVTDTSPDTLGGLKLLGGAHHFP